MVIVIIAQFEFDFRFDHEWVSLQRQSLDFMLQSLLLNQFLEWEEFNELAINELMN